VAMARLGLVRLAQTVIALFVSPGGGAPNASAVCISSYEASIGFQDSNTMEIVFRGKLKEATFG
jgi:hypothetical protein